MASTDGASPAQDALKEEPSDANHADLTLLKDSAPSAHGGSDVGKTAGERSGEASPVPSSPASGLSTTKSGTQTSASGQANPPPLSMPHPKKFSHVNINKKFLEKTSASTPSHTLSASPVTKTASTSQKPVLQTSTSHPRLVTAKLTATPQPSITTGPGWSRPSSAVPSSASTPTVGAKPAPAPVTSSGGVPLPPPPGKIIQPQPRASQDGLPQRRDTSTRPAWGNAKGNVLGSSQLDGVRNDFPTAAEVAQGRTAKAADKSPAPDAASVHKQSVISELQAEEDTFRGVHLDPNAHHWDEMEEDDDNFLDGVIEFEDGRQYKVQEQPEPQQDLKQAPPQGPGALGRGGAVDQPVSKEERFADDFDRSWPRSRPHQVQNHHREQRPDGQPISPSTSSHSPQEMSRVLFNERSNKLEPYSHQRYGAAGPNFNRRGSRSDYATSPTEPRRDAPPHAHMAGVQLLQKGPHNDSVPFSRAPGDRPPVSPQDGGRFHDRPPFQRDHPTWQNGGHRGPERYGNSFGPPHAPPFEDRSRRPPAGFEPPSPVDHRRQLPPHLSAVGSRHPQPPIGPAVRTEEPQPPLLPPPAAPSTHHGSPVPSASSLAAVSPAIPDLALPASTLPIVDEETARKAAMHNAAERARLRRQQEEEEREKERERARRKAAELEEKIKAKEQEAQEREKAETAKKPTEEQIVGLIEEAVSSVSTANPAESTSQRHPDARFALGRNASGRGGARPPFNARRTSFTPSTQTVSLPVQPSPASGTDSWRRKNPPAPAAPPIHTEAQKPETTPELPPPTFAHDRLDVQAGEEVEVVDFSDHGKLVGSEPQQQHAVPATGRPGRAVASDYFNDTGTSPQREKPAAKVEEETWRRAPPVKPPTAPMSEDGKSAPLSGPSVLSHHAPLPNGVHTPVPPYPSAHDDRSRRVSGHHQNGAHRPPVGPPYREAPMSALNDVMSRIRSTLDNLHHEAEASKPPQKWLPPALRPKPAHSDFAPPPEVFDVTGAEPPKSPEPAWHRFHVKLPHIHRAVVPLPPTELVWPRGQRRFRLDTHSFTPPIELLDRRDTTMNDVLFNRPRMVRGQLKYYVSIPRRRITRRAPSVETPASPVVNLPATPIRTRRPSLAKDSAPSNASSWRKAPSATTAHPPSEETKLGTGLDTVSRSPPPEAPSTSSIAPSLPKAVESTQSPVSAFAPLKGKSEPKMPVGSDVAFYRNSQVEAAVEFQPSVQFIVTDELTTDFKAQSDSRRPSDSQAPRSLDNGADASTPTLPPNGTSTPPQSHSSLSPWAKSKPFAMKDSPARAPDPEHLKAVWSQTSDKAQNQPVNSLKGIADDLTSVPFMLQDVKSDDGETPPQSSSGPWSRMTSHEVTRAFQQVPSPSSNSSQRPAPIAPSASSSTNSSISRHPGFAFSPPPMAPPMYRSPYQAYSPMMSPTPGQPAMYSQASPVPRPMVVNGGAPAYGQPVWVPAMSGAAPPPSAGMIRSPYPAQLMPYPAPGGPVPMYPPTMPMQNPPQQNGVQGRPPAMAMMSPVMQPAMTPMYAGSPVLVPSLPAMPPGQGYPMPNQASRPPMRPYEQPTNGAHMHPSPMRQLPQNAYSPLPPNYARPSW
ncbi:hypothetical protein C8Q78DRAFT_1093678 [Trametes maxima]|nr:hypothetical protein C8Q78DRAFT_1093678 [Trametes maxima]